MTAHSALTKNLSDSNTYWECHNYLYIVGIQKYIQTF